VAKWFYFYQHAPVRGVLVNLCLVLFTAGILSAQSHPGWWTYASPDATALVGIDWHALRTSPFADGVREELGPGGLGFPALDCLDQSTQILVSSPALLAVVSGSFAAPTLGQQATAKGFRAGTYKNVNVWIAPQSAVLSIALMNPQIVLLGSRKTLEEAIDRATDLAAQEGETARATKPRATKRYSPLLARAAQFARNTDLWVVSSRLPDPLASRFVPLEIETRGFEGWVSAENGLRLEAVLLASSKEEALVIAEHLRGTLAGLTSLARGIELHVDGDEVGLSFTATSEQFNASLKNVPAPAVPPSLAEVASIPPPPPAVTLPPENEKPKQPQVIRIVGLDQGPVEIPFPDSSEHHQ
jgi:hypothetical protein